MTTGYAVNFYLLAVAMAVHTLKGKNILDYHYKLKTLYSLSYKNKLGYDKNYHCIYCCLTKLASTALPKSRTPHVRHSEMTHSTCAAFSAAANGAELISILCW